MKLDVYVLPFGRWRGHPLSAVPDRYLSWLRSIADRDPLRVAVELEVERRIRAAEDQEQEAAWSWLCGGAEVADGPRTLH